MIRAFLFALIALFAFSPAHSQERSWILRREPDPAQLAYATPGADDWVVAFTCLKDSGQIIAAFPAAQALGVRQENGLWLDDVGRPAPWPISVTLSAGAAQTTIPGEAIVDATGRGSIVRVEFADRAPVAEAFADEGVIRLAGLGEVVEAPEVPRGELRGFFRYCR
ncbi:MAG: hypothetical protein A2882_15660 [Phenylobacterium sp. RIFCSPHIGHO2_01_FULL_70_10]|nr:MAG: hypothetical protein A2882_15660 [Phenylobacterium sp. RIFCSPHIGHO2_01_FULL_70_10]